MSLAVSTASDSYCLKRQVGCVIARDGRSIVNGFNGTLEGSDNSCEKQLVECPGCGKMIDLQSMDYTSTRKGDIAVRTYVCKCNVAVNFTEKYIDSVKLETKGSVIHAEANAIIFSAKHGIPLKDTTIYITTSPCVNCATLIYGAGIKEVVYKKEYKTLEGVELLKKNGILVRKYVE